SRGRSQGPSLSSAPGPWRRRSARERGSPPPRAGSCCSHRPALPSTSTATTKSAAITSARWSRSSWRGTVPRRITADRTLFSLAVVLTVFGIVMVGSASSYYSLDQSGMTVFARFLLRQIVYACAGLLVMHRLMRTDYHVFERRHVALGLLGATALLLLLVFLFHAHKGTHRWIPLGL